MLVAKEELGQGPTPQPLSVPGGNLTFDQQKELLLLQLSHDSEKHLLEVDKQFQSEQWRRDGAGKH